LCEKIGGCAADVLDEGSSKTDFLVNIAFLLIWCRDDEVYRPQRGEREWCGVFQNGNDFVEMRLVG
jgi:hypothetical protein